MAPLAVAMGQSSVAISPFVSYVPSATQNPLAGMALTFGGTTGLALRGSADMSVANPNKDNSTAAAGSAGGFRPWGADADAVLFLGGLGGGATVFSRALAPYLFSGIGLTGGDSAGVNVVHNGWSYGAGATIPLGFDADLFGEARWRMTQYVLPTAKDAPDSKSELRFGLSFHVGGSRQPAPEPRRRGRRYSDAYDDYDNVAVATSTPVIVQESQPVVYEPDPVIIHREPVIVQRDPVVVVHEPVASVPRVDRVTVTRSTITLRRNRTIGGLVIRSRARTVQTGTATNGSTRETKREVTRRRRF